jgi:hypothetical protein
MMKLSGTVTGVTLMLAVLAHGSLYAQTMNPSQTKPTNPPSRPARNATAKPAPADPPAPSRPAPPSIAVLSKATSTTEFPVSPIECWWKTDRSAVSVGEHFQLTLTCAVLATERVSVVVDESSLEPSALHLTPFEIVGGQRFRDIQNAPRKFFQYQYTMRVLGEEFFGREVLLPRLQIPYRVQNSLQGGAALQGRETQYSLVPVPIRVLSLVPPGADDIRDTPAETFGDVETRLFRSNLFLIVSGVAFVLAGLLAVMLIARAAVKGRAATAVRHRPVAPIAVLSAALREIGTVRSETQREGWTSELAGRAAAALRLAGAVALSRPISQKEVDRKTPPSEGQIPALPGLATLRGKKVMLSAAITPDSAASNGNSPSSELWRSLSQSLGALTSARYARNGTLDGAALDAALADSEDAIKRLRVRQLLRFGRSRRHAEIGGARQTWAR